jgi:hypothetical protein
MVARTLQNEVGSCCQAARENWNGLSGVVCIECLHNSIITLLKRSPYICSANPDQKAATTTDPSEITRILVCGLVVFQVEPPVRIGWHDLR